jgi:hypothetical protein
MNPALDSRARFEAHRLEKTGRRPRTWGAGTFSGDEVPTRLQGKYVEPIEQAAWEAWQAAIASIAAMVPVYRCTLMSRAAMKKAGQVGWFVDCAGGQTLEMRDAVQSDIDRCNLGESHSRDPADWMCETIPHGALVARAAIVHTMPTDFYVVAPPTPQDPPIAALAAKE